MSRGRAACGGAPLLRPRLSQSVGRSSGGPSRADRALTQPFVLDAASLSTFLTSSACYPSIQLECGLALGAAKLDHDLAKNRVDLHRWRQRTALLKVRLSSAHEDVARYRRMAALLCRQTELEAALKTQAGLNGAELGMEVVRLSGRIAEQAAVVATLQAELLRAHEAVAERDAAIDEQHAAMLQSSEAAEAALAEARANCERLQKQLAAVQERAALADQTAAAAKVRGRSRGRMYAVLH